MDIPISITVKLPGYKTTPSFVGSKFKKLATPKSMIRGEATSGRTVKIKLFRVIVQ